MIGACARKIVLGRRMISHTAPRMGGHHYTFEPNSFTPKNTGTLSEFMEV